MYQTISARRATWHLDPLVLKQRLHRNWICTQWQPVNSYRASNLALEHDGQCASEQKAIRLRIKQLCLSRPQRFYLKKSTSGSSPWRAELHLQPALITECLPLCSVYSHVYFLTALSLQLSTICNDIQTAWWIKGKLHFREKWSVLGIIAGGSGPQYTGAAEFNALLECASFLCWYYSYR